MRRTVGGFDPLPEVADDGKKFASEAESFSKKHVKVTSVRGSPTQTTRYTTRNTT